MAVNLEEYFKTVFEEKLLVKMPDNEDEHLTPATKLLEKRREMSEVQQALTAQKEEFHMKMESLQQRREELEKKEVELKKALLKFDKFLKENDLKKARAKKKEGDERELIESKEKDMNKLLAELGTLQKERVNYLNRLERNQLFQKFMDKVTESAEDFHEVRGFVARYETLVATHADLRERDNLNQDKMESLRQDHLKFTEEKNNELIMCNNALSGLQARLDRAQSRAAKFEAQWNHIQVTAASKTLELGKIKMASHNLFQLVSHHKRVTSAHHREEEQSDVEDTSAQLEEIQTFIQDLTQITNELARSKNASYSTVGASSSGQ